MKGLMVGGLLSAKVGGSHRFYVPDMQGHVRQVTDVDGDAIAEYQDDAGGLIQLTAASALAFGDWGYTWDGKPGRYYVQQRHLRVDQGRWMSVDPVETEPPYLYVGDRPTWAVDPSGEQGGRLVLPADPPTRKAALTLLAEPPVPYDARRWGQMDLGQRAHILSRLGIGHGFWTWETQETAAPAPRAWMRADRRAVFMALWREQNRLALVRLEKQKDRPVPTPPVNWSTGRTVDKVANAELAQANGALWVYEQVKTDGAWDFKNNRIYWPKGVRPKDDALEVYGNYHFGYVCAAAGIPEKIALSEAGRLQRDQVRGAFDKGLPPKPSLGEPAARRMVWYGGRPPYGDDPVDQYWITVGYRDYRRDRDRLSRERRDRMNRWPVPSGPTMPKV